MGLRAKATQQHLQAFTLHSSAPSFERGDKEGRSSKDGDSGAPEYAPPKDALSMSEMDKPDMMDLVSVARPPRPLSHSPVTRVLFATCTAIAVII